LFTFARPIPAVSAAARQLPDQRVTLQKKQEGGRSHFWFGSAARPARAAFFAKNAAALATAGLLVGGLVLAR